jgi:hypothetical protein
MRRKVLPPLLAGAALFGFAAGMGCGMVDNSDDALTSEQIAELQACHLPTSSTMPLGKGDHLRACRPNDVKKTTICHIPPGNPANAHTICVGNAAVPAHVANHGDSIGACQNERPCQPPPPSGAGGSDQPPPPPTGGTGGSDQPPPPPTGGTGGTVVP